MTRNEAKVYETTVRVQALLPEPEGTWDEIETDVEVTYRFHPGDPGMTWGPPERCYPPSDPEVEIVLIERVEDELEVTGGLTESEYGGLVEEIIEHEHQLMLEYQKKYEAEEEMAWDAELERMRS